VDGGGGYRSPPLAEGDEEGGTVGKLAGWLSDGWSWDWFYTLTFEPIRALRNVAPGDRPNTRHQPVGPGHSLVGWSASDRYFREWVKGVEERGTLDSVFWTRSREVNPNHEGGTHFHGLIGGVGTQRRDRAWREWFGAHGNARIEPIEGVRSREAVARYVSKYVMKDGGELLFSDNLGSWRRESDE